MKPCWLSYAVDESVRFHASSGGSGSGLLKWLFDNGIIGTAVSYTYCPEELCYKPELIYRFEDYRQTGSIYHEVGLISFLKEHLDEIRGGFSCFCLPCQAKAVRQLLTRAGHEVFILGMVCSSQLSIDATRYLLRLMHIPVEDVADIKYRGDGWPSGVRISKKDGSVRLVPNLASEWTKIFHSRLFNPKKCFTCAWTLNPFADITLADPWLPEVLETERTGKTLLVADTEQGETFLHGACQDGYLTLEKLPSDSLEKSQAGTLRRKSAFRAAGKAGKQLIDLYGSEKYRRWILSGPEWLFSLHCKLKDVLERWIIRKHHETVAG